MSTRGKILHKSNIHNAATFRQLTIRIHRKNRLAF